MHWLARVALITAGNMFALWVANLYVPGLVVSMNLVQLIVLAFALAVLNFVLKPILDLIFTPVIVLTLGLGVLIVNGIIIWLLPFLASRVDFLNGSISIQTIPALILTTLIVSVVNFVIHLAL